MIGCGTEVKEKDKWNERRNVTFKIKKKTATFINFDLKKNGWEQSETSLFCSKKERKKKVRTK